MATEHAQISKWKDELLPNIVDHLSRETPEALYAEYPISPLRYDAGYCKITYRDLANAVNGAAWWMSQTLGPSTQHEVLTYIGPNDIRYIVLVLAAVKTGYVLFLTSPRNSVAAHVKLFERLKCTKLLSPEPSPAPVSTILEAHCMQPVPVPNVEDLLGKPYPHYIYNKTFKEARNEPLVVIHTSGSTGFPKPLILTNETAARNMNMLAQDPPACVRSLDRLVQGKRVLNCFPPFHGACLASHLFAAIPFGTVMIAPLAGAIPTAQGVVEALHQTTANAAFLVPSIVLELAQDASLLDYCSQNLERCLYAGGDLPQAVGDKVAAKLPLVCQYGASEVGLTPQLLPEEMGPYDWKYVFFHPCLGTEFRHVADRSYELYVKHDPKKEKEQPTFTVLPDLREYGTRDLFSPHPTLPNLWSWRARTDDIIVFLNGEKTNPISMEHHIVAENSEVLTAIVLGTQRFQPALLLEPAEHAAPQNTAEEAAFIERVWPSIEEANKTAPAHARIDKAMILPMSPSKPVIRAGKGTTQRAATLRQYSAELDRLYQNADMDVGPAEGNSGPIDVQGIEAVSKMVKTIFIRLSGISNIDSHDNFFEFGLDSLQALSITRELRQTLRMPGITIATVYSNPSIAKLSEAVQSLQNNKQKPEDLNEKTRGPPITVDESSEGIVPPSLPQLPLPDLRNILDQLLESRKVFASPEEFDEMKKATQAFEDIDGPPLLEELKQTSHASDTRHDSWEREVYTSRREPLQDYSTFFFGHPVDGAPIHTQTERAAIIAIAALDYKAQLESSPAQPDTLNEQVLCTKSHGWLFHTTREPHTGMDKLMRHLSNREIVVLKNGHVFQLNVPLDPTFAMLEAAFAEITSAATASIPALATLTSLDRDSWAYYRETLLLHSANSDVIDAVERAAFVICLDDSAPSTASERCTTFMLNDRSFNNRWLDKTIQFIVTANGVSALVCEHTKLDGSSVRQLCEATSEAIMAYDPSKRTTTSSSKVGIKELAFDIPSAITTKIIRQQQACLKHYAPIACSTLTAPLLSKEHLMTAKLPVNATAHITILLAVRLFCQRFEPVWETVSLATFDGGRVDLVQTVTPAVVDFFNALPASMKELNENADRERTIKMADEEMKSLRQLLRTAVTTHTKLIARAAAGRGFVTQLYHLLGAAIDREEKKSDNSMSLPELFRTKAWLECDRHATPKRFKTDCLGSDSNFIMQEGGFLMPEEGSVFVHYEVRDSEGYFVCQGRDEDVSKFVKCLRQATEVVGAVI